MIPALLLGLAALANVGLVVLAALGLRWRRRMLALQAVVSRQDAERVGLVGMLQRAGIGNVTATWHGDDLHMHGEWIHQGRKEGRA